MLRSSRLINEQIIKDIKLYKYEEKELTRTATIKELRNRRHALNMLKLDINLKCGDEMTGFEIIASLPIEAQRNIYLEETVIPKGNCANVRAFKAVLSTGKILLTGVYTWNGTTWEPKA